RAVGDGSCSGAVDELAVEDEGGAGRGLHGRSLLGLGRFCLNGGCLSRVYLLFVPRSKRGRLAGCRARPAGRGHRGSVPRLREAPLALTSGMCNPGRFSARKAPGNAGKGARGLGGSPARPERACRSVAPPAERDLTALSAEDLPSSSGGRLAVADL